MQTGTPSRPASAPHTRQPRWHLQRVPVIIALIALLGAAALLYPSGATWVSSYQQARSVDKYSSDVTTIGPANRVRELNAASAYNKQLATGNATIAANTRLPVAKDTTAIPGYADQLNADDNGLMARIRIPSIGVDLPIYHGTSESVLDKGVGHLEGTSLPVGGPGTNTVLTGHRGLATAELFTRLTELHKGNRFTIQVFGKVMVYRIIKTEVVEPSQTQSLHPIAGKDLVTLVTCTPLFINSQRILVTAERVLPPPPADVAAARHNATGWGFPWWAIVGGLVSALLTGYVWWQGRPQ